MSISSAYNIQTVASTYDKNSLSKHPSSLNDPKQTSSIEVVKSGQKVLADGIKNSPRPSSNQTAPKQELHEKDHLNTQNIKRAIFGNNNSNLLNQIESTINIENFSQKAKKVNVYVDEMVSNIKEIMDLKGVTKEPTPNDNYNKRFNITL